MQRIKKIILHSLDIYFSRRSVPLPRTDRLRSCKLVSHRGEHDNREVFENTLQAFEWAYRAGVWGIELDLRWTRDLEPVIFHDPDTRRLFGDHSRIGQLRLDELHRMFPLVPTLDQVVERFGQKMHLMLEIKSEIYPEPDYQYRLLMSKLTSLKPGTDYHLISLSPPMFRHFSRFPSRFCLPIADLNLPIVSKIAIREQHGGILGHYLLVSDRYQNRHGRHGQKIGTGFAESPSCLFRELNRGVEWIFSNQAAVLQQVINKHMDAG